MNRPSMLDWHHILQVHYRLTMFQAIRYALWLTVDPLYGASTRTTLSQAQYSFECGLAKITLANLAGQIREKTH